jgi:MFS family permease
VTDHSEWGARPSLVTRPFIALASAALAFYVAAGIILPITPTFVERRLGGGSVDVGIVFASFAIASLVLRPIVGWSSDRFGRRPLLIGGAALTVVGMLLHLAAADIAILVAARSLLGAGEAFFLVAALAAASDLAPPARRGEALSFLSLSLYLGIAIGPIIGEWLLDGDRFELVWVVTASIAAVAVGLTLIVPETAPMRRSETHQRSPIIHPAALFPGVIILAGMWGMAGFFAFLPGHVESIGMVGVSLPLFIYAMVVVALRIVGATVPDRFGPVRVGSIALMLAAIGLAIIGAVATPVGLLVGTAVFASGVAFIMPALVSLVVSRVPAEERGTAVGTTAVFLDVAFGAAPVALGLVAVDLGTAATFLLSAVIAASGSGLLLVWRAAMTPGKDMTAASDPSESTVT